QPLCRGTRALGNSAPIRAVHQDRAIAGIESREKSMGLKRLDGRHAVPTQAARRSRPPMICDGLSGCAGEVCREPGLDILSDGPRRAVLGILTGLDVRIDRIVALEPGPAVAHALQKHG